MARLKLEGDCIVPVLETDAIIVFRSKDHGQFYLPVSIINEVAKFYGLDKYETVEGGIRSRLFRLPMEKDEAVTAFQQGDDNFIVPVGVVRRIVEHSAESANPRDIGIALLVELAKSGDKEAVLALASLPT